MLFTKLRMISVVVILLGAGASSMAVLAQQRAQQRPTPNVEIAAELPQPATKPPTTDSLGDPLPPGARLRLGTLRFRPPSTVVDLALSPDETTLITVGDELIAWDVATGKERWRAAGGEYRHNPRAAAYGERTLAFSPDGVRFYTPGQVGQNEIVVWETSSGRHEILTIAAPNRILGNMEGGTRSVDITPDGRKLDPKQA